MKLALGPSEAAHREALDRLGRERAVERLWSGDATLWTDDPSHRRIVESSLGWLTVADSESARVADLAAFGEEVAGEADRVVVLGMGGSSLAPLVFASSFPRRTDRPALEVLDSTEPGSVLDVAARCDPARTLYVVSSKSGTTLEPNVFFDYFFDGAERALGGRAGSRFVVVTDPGSALEKLAAARKVRRVFAGDPRIGGRYSALSAFGLVPASLYGVDVGELLARARRMAALCRKEPAANPGAQLGAALAALALGGRDKLTFSVGAPAERFGLWIEQLVAESTGKDGRGILPVEGEPLGAPEAYGGDRFFVRIDAEGEDNAAPRSRLAALARAGHPTAHAEISGALDLGAEMFRWEFATAVAGALLGIDAFDQPNVQEAKDRTNEILNGSGAEGAAARPDDRAALAKLFATLRAGDYFAVTAYVPPTDANAAALQRTRLRVRDAKRVATTVGFGPRFLHSTGQYHKGGPDTGVFLQLTAEAPRDAPIPGRPWGFARVVSAQAAGDLAALRARGRRVLSMRLPDVPGGLAALDTAAAAALGASQERG